MPRKLREIDSARCEVCGLTIAAASSGAPGCGCACGSTTPMPCCVWRSSIAGGHVRSRSLVRLASWIFIVCAVVTALSVFMPVLEVGGSALLSKRQTLSLHGAAENRKLVRRLLAASRHSHALRLGNVALDKVAPHAGGRTKGYLEDAGDAYETLSGLSDDDVKQAGRGLVALTWTIIGLCAAMSALVFFDVVGGVFHRGRII